MLKTAVSASAGARWLLVAVLLAQLADTVSFAVGVSLLGIGVEGNPLMRAAYETGGLAGVLAAKGTAIVAVLAILIWGGERFPRLRALGGGAALAIGLLGASVNALAIAISV